MALIAKIERVAWGIMIEVNFCDQSMKRHKISMWPQFQVETGGGGEGWTL